jgi:hypothetical protein
VRLSTPKKILATGAALLGILLGAAGIAAATTGTGAPARSAPAVHAPQADPSDTPEANDVPDTATDAGDHGKSADAEHEDAGSDGGETDGQG